MLSSHLLRCGRRAHRRAILLGWDSCGRWCGRGGRCSSRTGEDRTQDITNTNRLAFGTQDRPEQTRMVSSDLKVDLIGLQLHHRLTGGNRLPLPLQPTCHRCLNDRLAEGWYFDIVSHGAQLRNLANERDGTYTLHCRAQNTCLLGCMQAMHTFSR